MEIKGKPVFCADALGGYRFILLVIEYMSFAR